MKVRTDRLWSLNIEQVRDCIEVIENHEGCEDDYKPYIVIPVEAIDDVVLRLLQFKRKIQKGKYK